MPIKSPNIPKLFSGIDATAFAAIMVVLVFAELIAGTMSYNPHHGVSTTSRGYCVPFQCRGAPRRRDAGLHHARRKGLFWQRSNCPRLDDGKDSGPPDGS